MLSTCTIFGWFMYHYNHLIDANLCNNYEIVMINQKLCDTFVN